MSKAISDGMKWAVAALPAVVPLVLIVHWGVDTHFWDEWDPGIAGLLIKLQQHQLGIGDLVAQHNEHRMVIPRLIFLGLAGATRWNNFAYLICTWLIVAGTSALFLAVYRRTTDRAGEVWIVWFFCNLVLFTANQDQTWLWGFAIPNVMPGLFLMGAIWAGASGMGRWSKTGIMVGLAVAASFSNGNGLLCWPVLGIMMAFWKWWRQLIVWVCACASVVSIYFIHYVKPDFGGVTGDHGTGGQIAGFFLAFLGNSFSTAIPGLPETVSIMSGLLMVGLFAVAAGYFLRAWAKGRREFCLRMLPWLGVGGFALLNAALAARNRAGFGIDQALETRYVCSSMFLPAALVALWAMVGRDWGGKGMRGALAGGLVVIQAASFPGALRACRSWNESQRGVKGAVLMSQVLPGNPELVKVFPVPGILLREAAILNGMGYLHPPLIEARNANLIRENEAGAAGEMRGRLVRGMTDGTGAVNLIGWAVSLGNERAADAVFITYENQSGESIICAMAEMGVKSEGVANEMHDAAYLWAGWHVRMPMRNFAGEPNPLRLRAWGLDIETGRAVPLDGSYWVER